MQAISFVLNMKFLQIQKMKQTLPQRIVVLNSSISISKYSSDRDTLRVECKSAVFHADFLLLRLSRFGNSTGSAASS